MLSCIRPWARAVGEVRSPIVEKKETGTDGPTEWRTSIVTNRVACMPVKMKTKVIVIVC